MADNMESTALAFLKMLDLERSGCDKEEIFVRFAMLSKNIFCLFVCLQFFVPLEIFSLIWRRHNCR